MNKKRTIKQCRKGKTKSKKCKICGEIIYGTGNLKHEIMGHITSKHNKWVMEIIFPIYQELNDAKRGKDE
jgi:hypothetical protein